MLDGVLSTADLALATGFARATAIRRCLERQGVPYFEGKDGPWTTLALVAAAKRDPKESDRYSLEML